MLHISIFEEPLSVKIRLEGALDPESQAPLEEALQRASAHGNGRKLLIDAADISSEDDFTLSLLMHMEDRGFELVALRPALDARLTRQVSDDCKDRCSWIQKLLYWIASVECCIPRKLRTRACAMLRANTSHGRHGLPCKP